MAANESQALSQDDIDALLAEMTGDAPAASAPPEVAAAPVAATPVAAAPAPRVEGDASPQTAPVTAGEHPTLDRRISASVAEAPVVAPATASVPKGPGPLSQDDIDALVAATVEKAVPAKPATVVVKQATGVVHAPPATSRTQVTGVPPAMVPTTKRTAKGGAKPGTDIEKLLSSVESSAQTKAKNTMQAMPGLQPGVPLDQEDIDKLLAELGATATNTPPPMQAPGPGTKVGTKVGTKAGTKTGTNPQAASAEGVPAAAAQPTLALSTEELDALMNKHSVGGDTEAGVEMIDQSDIDALVKQLATATGEPDQEKISDALAKHGDEIDKLLEKTTDDRMTQDAVEAPRDITVKTTPASTMAMPVMHTGPVVAHLPPAAFRGTRALLAAAVLLLAMCAGTLAMVVGAVRGLSLELKQERTAQLVPTDNYHDDFTAAFTKLSGPDEGEAAKGVIFLERLQKRHPEHERDIALELARHHRRTGAVVRAARDYAMVMEGAAGPCDDPRIYLEYAECLFQQQEEAAATRQVYTLLANESFYRADRDRRGLERSSDEQSRNRQALQDGYLILGRMLASTWQQGGTIAAASGHGGGGGTSAGHAVHGQGASIPEHGAPMPSGHATPAAAAHAPAAAPASHGEAAPAPTAAAPAHAPAATPAVQDGPAHTAAPATTGHGTPAEDAHAPTAPPASGKGH